MGAFITMIVAFALLLIAVNSSLLPKRIGNGAKSKATAFLKSFVVSSSVVLLSTKLVDAVASKGGFPLKGGEELMSQKGHGTSISPVQEKLKYACDVKLADRICNFNRNWAEHAGYWTSETTFLKELNVKNDLTFYDSVTGVPLFKISPTIRPLEEWVEESKVHGWPSFRDNEVVWDNVRSLRDGEMVSLTGTHLGHNLPDIKGNRYCINLVSIAGYPKV